MARAVPPFVVCAAHENPVAVNPKYVQPDNSEWVVATAGEFVLLDTLGWSLPTCRTSRKSPAPEAVAPVMKVEIWSDVVCPWCYIGKRRFERALSDFAHRDEVEVLWRSFELDPSARPSGEIAASHTERLAAKYGRTTDQAQQMLDQMTATAAGEGLTFRFDRSRTGNTFDAHRLLHLALEHGLQDELKERFDRATFGEGLSVSDHEELAALAVEVGLSESEVGDVLASDRYAGSVRADEAQAQAYQISGVPFFVVDGRYGVSGAQPSEQIGQVLARAWQEKHPVTVLPGGAEGDACEGDTCAV